MALPVLLNEGKDSRSARPPTVAVVAPGGEALASPLSSAGSGGAPAPAPSDPAGAAKGEAGDSTGTTDPPSFLSGPTTPLTAKSITVAVPGTQPAQSDTGRASFRRWPPGSTRIAAPCAAWFLAVGTHVTVTNLDNGHTVDCVVADRTGVPDDELIVLDTALFTQLADVVEAPIPVTITWT